MSFYFSRKWLYRRLVLSARIFHGPCICKLVREREREFRCITLVLNKIRAAFFYFAETSMMFLLQSRVCERHVDSGLVSVSRNKDRKYQRFLTHRRNKALSCRGQPAYLDRGCSTRVCWNASVATDGFRLPSRGNPDPKELTGGSSWGHLFSIPPAKPYHPRRSRFLSSYLAGSGIKLYIFHVIDSACRSHSSFENFFEIFFHLEVGIINFGEL